MQKGQNFNRPLKGEQIKVEPIKDVKDIKAIKKLLSDNPRDYALFVVGINTNLRASDLLGITAGQVRNLQPMDEITLKERKTGKGRRISLNKACVEAIKSLLGSQPYKDEESLFKGQRGTLTVPSVNRLVKSWCSSVNLKGNYGSHSLRKTWGFYSNYRNSTLRVTCKSPPASLRSHFVPWDRLRRYGLYFPLRKVNL